MATGIISGGVVVGDVSPRDVMNPSVPSRVGASLFFGALLLLPLRSQSRAIADRAHVF